MNNRTWSLIFLLSLSIGTLLSLPVAAQVTFKGPRGRTVTIDRTDNTSGQQQSPATGATDQQQTNAPQVTITGSKGRTATIERTQTRPDTSGQQTPAADANANEQQRTNTRQVTITSPNGRTSTIERTQRRTDDSVQRQTTVTGANGQQRSVTVERTNNPKGGVTVERNSTTTYSNGETSSATHKFTTNGRGEYSNTVIRTNPQGQTTTSHFEGEPRYEPRERRIVVWDWNTVDLWPGWASTYIVPVTAVPLAVTDESVASSPNTDTSLNRFAYLQILEDAVARGWLLSTSEVATLLHLSPNTVLSYGQKFEDAGFVFTRVGTRKAGEVAWAIAKQKRIVTVPSRTLSD